MLIQKVTKARYRYIGDDRDFYEQGEEYYLTVTERRFLWRHYIEVECRHGYADVPYRHLPVIIYTNKEAFDEDWAEIAVISKRASKKRS